MRDTLEVLPDGSTRTTSPGRTVPLFTNPEKPRKSRLGRLTHCTAIRNGAAASRSLSSGTVSRCSISAGPVYQGVFGERLVMLSPLKPEIGIATKLSMPMLFANADYSSPLPLKDTKSVGQGKSGSVRVDPGGLRINKKK